MTNVAVTGGWCCSLAWPDRTPAQATSVAMIRISVNSERVISLMNAEGTREVPPSQGGSHDAGRIDIHDDVRFVRGTLRRINGLTQVRVGECAGRVDGF